MRYRTVFLLMVAIGGNSSWSVPLRAQSNQGPDFTNENDILHGNRTLLQITDLLVVSTEGEYQLTTSNSSITKILWSPGGFPFPASKSFSGWMLNQPKAVTATVSYNTSGAYRTQSVAIANPQIGKTFTYDYGPFLRSLHIRAGAMADFNQDGYDDFAFCLGNGGIVVMTAKDVNNPQVGFILGSPAVLDPLNDMTAGDFNGDGQPEIAGISIQSNGELKLVIYNVDPKSLAITAASSRVLNTANAGSPITHVSIARGKFNTLSHDQLAVTFATSAGPSTAEIIDFASSSLDPTEGPQLTVSNIPIPVGYLEIKTGQFALPGNPYDQIVFHSSSTSPGGRFFEVLSANPIDLTLTAHSEITYNQLPCAAGIQVGNFDNQQPDPLNAGQNEHNPNSQIAFMYCTVDATAAVMNIYSIDPQTFEIVNPPDSFINLPAGVTAFNSSFVASDLQGRSMVLGVPTKVTINNSTPTIINAAPPMHVDYIAPVGGSKPEVLNISFIPDGFNSAFSLTQQSKTGGSTTGKLSWSAGVDLSVEGSYQIGNPDAGIGQRFSAGLNAADNFTRTSADSTINYVANSFGVSAATRAGDVVFFDDSRFNIWVYPVLGQTVCPKGKTCPPDQLKPLTVQFSGPDEIDTTFLSTEILSAFWYQPPWEWGTVFSYPATKDQLALIYPDTSNQTTLSNDVTFITDGSNKTIQAMWSSGTEQGSTTSTANSTSFDVTTSYAESVGISGIAHGGGSASLKLSGSVGFEHLRTYTSQLDSSNGIEILASGSFRDPGNYGYKVKPYILSSFPPSGVGDSQQPPQADIQKFGPLKTAFTADPMAITGGGAWWSQAYTARPDVALNHPSRWVLTTPGLAGKIPPNCANTGTTPPKMDCADIAPFYDDNGQPINPWVSNFYSMRGFFITSADKPGAGPQLGFATAGDKLDLAVRVYNYSLASMPVGTTVHVRFYAMPWDNQTNTPAGVSFQIAETTTGGPIPPFSDASDAPLNWKLVHTPAAFDTTPYAGKFLAFWVVVWMEDGVGGLVPEIQGHGLTSIPGTLTKPSDVPLEMAMATDGETTVSYSNNVGFYHYAFPVLPQTGLLGPVSNNPADVTLQSISAAKKRLRPGELDVITAVLKAGSEGASGLKVYFYDGDPNDDGRLLAVELASVDSNGEAKVRIPYYPASSGIYRVWAVVNKGKSYQTEGHTKTIVVQDPNCAHDCEHGLRDPDWDRE